MNNIQKSAGKMSITADLYSIASKVGYESVTNIWPLVIITMMLSLKSDCNTTSVDPSSLKKSFAFVLVKLSSNCLQCKTSHPL